MDALLSIVDAVGKDGNRVRPITLELACLVTRQILLAIEDEAVSCFIDYFDLSE